MNFCQDMFFNGTTRFLFISINFLNLFTYDFYENISFCILNFNIFLHNCVCSVQLHFTFVIIQLLCVQFYFQFKRVILNENVFVL